MEWRFTDLRSKQRRNVAGRLLHQTVSALWQLSEKRLEEAHSENIKHAIAASSWLVSLWFEVEGAGVG